MAMKRGDALNTITEGIAWVATLCDMRGAIHLFDANTISHEFYCRLLNEIHDLKLLVMDRIQANFPAVDLGDKINKRAFQITAEKGSDKIQTTLDRYVKHELANKYGKIQFLVIGDKQRSYKGVIVPAGLDFVPDNDIIDVKGLIRVIEGLGTERLQRIAGIVQAEIKTVDSPSGSTPTLKAGKKAAGERKKAAEETRKRVERLLQRLEAEVKEELAVRLGWRADPLLTGTADRSDFLVRTILEGGDYNVLGQLSATHTDLCVGKTPRAEQAVVVSALIDEAIPLVFPPEVAARLWDQIHLGGAAFFEVVDHHLVTIEGQMARADRMNARYRENSSQPLGDYEGESLLNRPWDAPIGKPESPEDVARSILVDIWKGNDAAEPIRGTETLDQLVAGLAGILVWNRGDGTRTLYAVHKVKVLHYPTTQTVHEEALRLIGEKLRKHKESKPRAFVNMPGFIFLLLAERSDHEDLRKIIVKVIRTRSEHARKRSPHAASE